MSMYWGATEHLGIDDISDVGLIFAGKVFVQQLCEAVAGDFGPAPRRFLSTARPGDVSRGLAPTTATDRGENSLSRR
jgi:hypothetical protein